MLAIVSTVFALVLAAAQLPATSPGNVPEPDGLWLGSMHGYTPSTLKGGTVIDPPALARLIESMHPVLIDVADADRKPAGMAANQPWSPRHHAIAGTVWMPGAGQGKLAAAAQAVFETRVSTLTGGDHDRAIVTYCHPDCWASWNAAKRLMTLGYRHVYWMPAGIEGWQEEHPTVVVKPDTAWAARPGADPGG